MGDFEKLLDKSFIRCHKRFIINSQYITNIDLTNNYVEVYNTSIPIGRTYKSGVEQVFERGK
jgi:DNA-binding LytR/AlgR family response regulator